ncbi:phage/plasmid replication protein, II/X family [Paraburkholderia sp. J12]|uniref:phage/plasmid replication protein, II/X family n=1 Tax=Paraburkholderia sp. J12 TaxID=2805432 RepID=UPI002ABD4D90|nr:phage/plasmid replication protein, II/X family [Paraburkholderia sp. J12]
MIDLLDVKIAHLHEQFGNERGKRYENSDAAPVFDRYSKKVFLRPGGAPVDAMSLDAGAAIGIRGCPLKPLQGHNVFGSNDVCLLAGTLIGAVLDALNIPYTEEQRAAWFAGEFDLAEVHITLRFGLPDGMEQKQFYRHILRNTAWEFRPGCLQQGTGIRLAKHQNGPAMVMYDKAQELTSRRTRAFRHLRAVVGEVDAAKVWKGLTITGSTSIRAELKVPKEYLARNCLTRGSAWTRSTVDDVYWEEMAKLRFESHVPLNTLRPAINRVVDRPLRHALELWTTGRELRTIYPASTLARCRSKVRQATGIDIVTDVPMKTALPVASILSRENLRPEFPQWAHRFPACAFGLNAQR